MLGFDSTLVFFINLIQLQLPSVTYTFVLMQHLLSEVQYQSNYTRYGDVYAATAFDDV